MKCNHKTLELAKSRHFRQHKLNFTSELASKCDNIFSTIKFDSNN
jgi:hypothetical protein